MAPSRDMSHSADPCVTASIAERIKALELQVTCTLEKGREGYRFSRSLNKQLCAKRKLPKYLPCIVTFLNFTFTVRQLQRVGDGSKTRMFL